MTENQPKELQLERYRQQLLACVRPGTEFCDFFRQIKLDELGAIKTEYQQNPQRGELFEHIFVHSKMNSLENNAKIKKIQNILHLYGTSSNTSQPDFLEVNDSDEIVKIYECKTSPKALLRKKEQAHTFKVSIDKFLKNLYSTAGYTKYEAPKAELMRLTNKRIKLASECELIGVFPKYMDSKDLERILRDFGYDKSLFIDITPEELDNIAFTLEGITI